MTTKELEELVTEVALVGQEILNWWATSELQRTGPSDVPAETRKLALALYEAMKKVPPHLNPSATLPIEPVDFRYARPRKVEHIDIGDMNMEEAMATVKQWKARYFPSPVAGSTHACASRASRSTSSRRGSAARAQTRSTPTRAQRSGAASVGECGSGAA